MHILKQKLFGIKQFQSGIAYTKNNLPGQWKIVNEISEKYLSTYRKPRQLIVLDSK